MAIMHMTVKTISRSAERSATATAAYCTGTAITDVRSGLEFDYTRKGGIEPDPVLLLPKDAPEWATDRAVLWNAVEQFETRKNSTVAREFIVALPSELDPESRRRLAVSFAQELVDRYGFVADVAIHAPSKKGDDRNHHAHILCSTRKLEQDGFTTKSRVLDDLKTGEVTRLREVWALRVNTELERNGVADRVDHRSHAARGLNILPTRHVGVAGTEMERRGDSSDRVAVNAEIRARNVELLQLASENKEIAAAVMSLLAEAERTHKEAQARVVPERDSFDSFWARIDANKQQRTEAAAQLLKPAPAGQTRPVDRLGLSPYEAEVAARLLQVKKAKLAEAELLKPATIANAKLLGMANAIEKGKEECHVSRESTAAIVIMMFKNDEVLKNLEMNLELGEKRNTGSMKGFCSLEVERTETGLKYVIRVFKEKAAEFVAYLRTGAQQKLERDTKKLHDKARELELPPRAKEKVKDLGRD